MVGGAILPRLHGDMIDGPGLTFGSQVLESVRVSFLLPAACYVPVAIYGLVMARQARA